LNECTLKSFNKSVCFLRETELGFQKAIRLGMTTHEGRVVLIGEASVGKTSLVNRFLHGECAPMQEPTAGAAFYSSKVTVLQREVSMQIWDTAGQERYRGLGPIYYRKSLAAIAVFDLTESDTMHALEHWISEYRDNADNPFIVVAANKSDRAGDILLKIEDTTEWASKFEAECIWTSAMTGEGVDDLFWTVARHFLEIGVPEFSTTGQVESAQDESGCC
jgi:small GTP-binding protein